MGKYSAASAFPFGFFLLLHFCIFLKYGMHFYCSGSSSAPAQSLQQLRASLENLCRNRKDFRNAFLSMLVKGKMHQIDEKHLTTTMLHLHHREGTRHAVVHRAAESCSLLLRAVHKSRQNCTKLEMYCVLGNCTKRANQARITVGVNYRKRCQYIHIYLNQ